MSPVMRLMLVLLAAAVAVPAANASSAPGKGRRVTVMTQNLYLGTDLGPIFGARTPFAVFGAVGLGWAQVQANDFPARAEAVADEIASADPDLVGLQEATLYRTDVPSDGPVSPAGTIAYDYVQLLVDALARRGLQYDVAATFTGTDAELPAGLPPALDVRLTDRVVVLARHRADEDDDRPWVSNPRTGSYAAAVTIPTVVGPIVLPRGWASVDVRLHGTTFRFVTTHLEAFASPVRLAQASELVSGPAAVHMPVVVVGDMNSGPGLDLGAYNVFAGAGFTDEGAGGAATCCHANDLHDPDPTLGKRIDLVLSRGFAGGTVDVVGEDPADRTANGLWPSDHAGVVATLQLPHPAGG